MTAARKYTLHADDGSGEPVGPVAKWPHTAEGAIFAISRAAELSVASPIAYEVHRPDGRILARYVDGERTDLAPLPPPAQEATA